MDKKPASLDPYFLSPIDNNRKLFFRTILIVGIIGSISLPIINILLNVKNDSMFIDIVAFFAFITIYSLFHIKKTQKISYWIITLVSLFAIVGINFQSPEFFNVKNVTLFATFPSIAFFLLGKKPGIVLSIVFSIIIFFLVLVHSDLPTAFQIAFDISIVIFIFFFYQRTQEKTQEELTMTISQITEQKEQLERMNNVMVDRELMMIQLKKRIEELEKQN